MKPIKIMDQPTQGLKDYLAQQPPNLTWTRFQNQDGTSARELRLALADLQHGLCGYCEQRLTIGDSQVEHFIPRSADTNGAAHQLDHTNMIACCRGGTPVNIYGPDTIQHDRDRVGDRSCGEAKGNVQDQLMLDPRNLPILSSLFTVRSNGRIEPNPNACQLTGIPLEKAQRTIDILKLDAQRLRQARARRWADINAKYASHLDDENIMRLAAHAELLPDSDDRLPHFFTANRSYFEHLADPVLIAPDSTWV